MSDLRQEAIEAMGWSLAADLKHTLASLVPMKLAPNTQQITENALDALLVYLRMNLNERVEVLDGWGNINDVYLADVTISDLLTALEETE